MDSADVIVRVPTKELVSGRYAPNRSRKYLVPEGAPEAAFRLFDGKERFLVRTALVRSADFKAGNAPVIDTPGKLAKLVRHIADFDQEHMVTVAVDNRMRLIAIHEVAIGARGHTSACPMDMLKIALLTSAPGVMVAHNHPSGDPRPSSEDVVMTGLLRSAAKCVGVNIIDHVVVGVDGWRSIEMSESGSW